MTGVGLRTLFSLARHAPGAMPLLRPLATRLTLAASPAVREAVAANAVRVFDGPPPPGFDRAVVACFYDFVRDLGLARGATAARLRSRIAAVEGRDAYLAARAAGGGCVLVTAHMGSFEVGLAALRDVEPHVHVVFKRDAFDGFERLRRRVRQTLGVHEAAIDDGWPTLVRLRDALRDNAVVVMQADRAMPGQKSCAVPFLGGRLRVPLGPLRLAQAAGCPVVPVFTVREPDGRFRVFLEPAVDPSADDAPARVAGVIARFVRRYPDQWLVLHKAFVEDEPRG